MDQIENEAAELVFDVPAWEIDGVFKNQDESYFVSRQPECGPSEEEECEKSSEASQRYFGPNNLASVSVSWNTVYMQLNNEEPSGVVV